MGIFIGSILIIFLLAFVLWLCLSPLFTKIGSLVGKKGQKFSKKWGGKKK